MTPQVLSTIHGLIIDRMKAKMAGTEPPDRSLSRRQADLLLADLEVFHKAGALSDEDFDLAKRFADWASSWDVAPSTVTTADQPLN